MKQIICYSGGHSSAICAVEAVRKYGKENVILLNHDIVDDKDGNVIEHHDIKRFKRDVADYLDLDITYANCTKYEDNTPLGVCLEQNCITNPTTQQALCTNKLKTEPFYDWLHKNYKADIENICDDIRIIYGFDNNEMHRLQRRVGVLATQGYKCDFPIALWKDRTIENIEEVGIKRPVTYKIFKHANCIGCLKAGMQHWYIVYCLYTQIFEKAKLLEKQTGYTIIRNNPLEELENRYYDMKNNKFICPNDREQSQTFWARVNATMPEQLSLLPCDCAVF